MLKPLFQGRLRRVCSCLSTVLINALTTTCCCCVPLSRMVTFSASGIRPDQTSNELMRFALKGKTGVTYKDLSGNH